MQGGRFGWKGQDSSRIQQTWQVINIYWINISNGKTKFEISIRLIAILSTWLPCIKTTWIPKVDVI